MNHLPGKRSQQQVHTPSQDNILTHTLSRQHIGILNRYTHPHTHHIPHLALMHFHRTTGEGGDADDSDEEDGANQQSTTASASAPLNGENASDPNLVAFTPILSRLFSISGISISIHCSLRKIFQYKPNHSHTNIITHAKRHPRLSSHIF